MRSWVALFLQGRRRKRAGSGPSAPVITGTAWEWSQIDEGYIDAYLEWTFDLGNFPPGNLEVWERDVNNADYIAGTLPIEQRSFWHFSVTAEAYDLYYRIRYVCGDVVGPFSSEVTVRPYPAPSAPQSLEGTPGGSQNVQLTWNMDNVQFDDGCQIEGRIGANPFAVLATTSAGLDSSFFHVSSTGTWDFRVRAYNGVGFSPYSNEVQIVVT